MRKILLFTVITTVLFGACSKDEVNFDAAEQLQKEIALIEAYLTNHSITAEKTENNIYYIITEEGSGIESPTATSTITVLYKGYFLDGTIFEQTQTGSPVEFSLSGKIITGWKEAIPLLKKGSKGTFFIPSVLAFGTTGSYDGTIPPNTTLVFDIELVDFTN